MSLDGAHGPDGPTAPLMPSDEGDEDGDDRSSSSSPRSRDSPSCDRQLVSRESVNAAFEGALAHAGTKRDPLTAKLAWAAFFAALGGLLFGYDLGIVSGALLQLENKEGKLDDTFNLGTFEQELVVSLFLIGAILASLTAGHLIDHWGRRIAIIANALVFLIGAIGLSLAQDLTQLLVARVVVGYAVSFSAVAECVYISEISPAERRGELVSLNELGITIGICLAYLVNSAFISMDGGWRYMFGLSAIPAVVQGIGMVWMPPSPRWLLLKGRVEEAEAALRAFRLSKEELTATREITYAQRDDCNDRVKGELSRIVASMRAQNNPSVSLLWSDKVLFRCMRCGCGVVLFQNFIGHANVLYYGATIFKASGLSNQHATLAQLGIGIVKVLSTIVSLRVVDHQGRRKLLLIGTVMIIVSLFVFASVSVAHPPPETNATESEIAEDMAGADAGRRWRRGSGGGGARHGEWGPTPSAASLHIQNFRVDQFVSQASGPRTFASPSMLAGRVARSSGGGHHRSTDTEAKPPIGVFVATILCLSAFVIAYAFSYGPVSWLVLSEIFPDDIRSRAVSIATIFNWTSNLVVASSFLTLLETIGTGGTFFLYTAIACCAFVFVYVYLPETKGKELQEIQQIMSSYGNK